MHAPRKLHLSEPHSSNGRISFSCGSFTSVFSSYTSSAIGLGVVTGPTCLALSSTSTRWASSHVVWVTSGLHAHRKSPPSPHASVSYAHETIAHLGD